MEFISSCWAASAKARSQKLVLGLRVGTESLFMAVEDADRSISCLVLTSLLINLFKEHIQS